MEAKLMKDDDYIVACKGRKEEVSFWWMKANKYTDLLEDADGNVCYLKQWVIKLKQEIEKGSNYEEGHQGKRVRYNALTEEMSMNTNYSQVLQAPAPTDIHGEHGNNTMWGELDCKEAHQAPLFVYIYIGGLPDI